MDTGNHCNRNVVCAGRDATVLEAAHLMRHNHVGDVIIADEVEGGLRPIGIVTLDDLLLQLLPPLAELSNVSLRERAQEHVARH